MSDTNPRVSIIVPCYNQARFLSDAIRSLRAQTRPEWEAIVVNDGSSDDTHAVAAQWAAEDPRVRCVDQENAGLAGARNTGLDHARGGYIQFLDADDLLFPTKLEKQLDLLQAAPSPGVAYCRPFFCLDDDTGTEISAERPFFQLDPERPVYDLALRWERTLSIPCHAFLFDARLFRDPVVRFDVTLPNHEDWECWMRLFAQGPRTVFVDEKLVKYRRHSQSMCRDEQSMRTGFLQALRQQRALQADNMELRWILDGRIRAVAAGRDRETPVDVGVNPRLSVVLTSYNYADYVGEAIESVYSQSYRNIELVIVDDGSTDRSRAVIEAAVKYAPFPTELVFKENGGQSSACNAGFARTTGALVAFIDSDDRWHEDRAQKVVDFVRMFPDGGVYQHQLETSRGPKRGGLISADLFRLWKEWGGGVFNLADDAGGALFSPFLPTTGLTFRREVLEKVMPVPEALRTCPDAYLTRTCAAYGPLYSLPQPLGLWRDHGNNAGLAADTTFRDYWLPVILPVLNAYYKKHNLPLQLVFEPDRTRGAASRMLGETAGLDLPKQGVRAQLAQARAAAPARARAIESRLGHFVARQLRRVLSPARVERIRRVVRRIPPEV